MRAVGTALGITGIGVAGAAAAALQDDPTGPAAAVTVAALLTAIAGARIARAHAPRGRHRQ